MDDMWILEGHTPKKVSWDDYLAFCKAHPEEGGRKTWRRVAYSEKGDINVSTVFLTMDHSWNGGPPILFETMIFGGEHDQYQDRYGTWDAAVEGHRRACEMAGVSPDDIDHYEPK